jgi:glucokinase
MALLGIDLGATKVSFAVFNNDGKLLSSESRLLDNRTGQDVGKLITDFIQVLLANPENDIKEINSIGISVPGISHSATGTVWAPNIPGWEDYPLLREVKRFSGNIPVTIDSDRACYILGEVWQGNARNCTNAIYLAIGTGIGAGILIDGKVLRGNNDIAGAIGWMALDRPFYDKYTQCGNFEYCASGGGIVKVMREYIMSDDSYRGKLINKRPDDLNTYDFFSALEEGDKLAERILDHCIEYWGMAIANLVSLFNPEKILLGGGIFGPAARFIPDIIKEAEKWSQPISFKHVIIEKSSLAGDAGVYGAAYLALENSKNKIL